MVSEAVSLGHGLFCGVEEGCLLVVFSLKESCPLRVFVRIYFIIYRGLGCL